MRLTEACELNRQKLDKTTHNQLKVRIELKQLERENSQYTSEWIECYNQEREKSGLFEYVPGENEFEEYEKTVLEDLEKNFLESDIKIKEYKAAESKNEWDS